jgi:large subunit ribosomal protein L23
MSNIVKKPLITEKNTIHNAAGVYVFEVSLKSSKPEIKKAVESDFGVKVIDVKTSICRGRAKQTKFGMGKTPHWKKAFVKLAPGEKIAMFEGV